VSQADILCGRYSYCPLDIFEFSRPEAYIHTGYVPTRDMLAENHPKRGERTSSGLVRGMADWTLHLVDLCGLSSYWFWACVGN
jgi:hypothetical protein